MRLAHQFQGQRSRSPGPLMLTHIVHRIFRMARPMNFILGVWMEDDDPNQPQVPWPSNVKAARLRDQSEPSWPNAVSVSLEAGRGILCRLNLVATLLVKSFFGCELVNSWSLVLNLIMSLITFAQHWSCRDFVQWRIALHKHVALFNYVQCPSNYCDGVTLNQCLINNNNNRLHKRVVGAMCFSM